MNFHLPNKLQDFHPSLHSISGNPRRDWYLIVAVSSILLLGLAGWSYVSFLQLTESSAGTSGSTNQSEDISSVLAQVSAIFAERSATEAHYLSDYHFVDPSK